MEQDVTDLKGRYRLTGLPDDRSFAVSVYYTGYGHNSFKGLAAGEDYDLQIMPQGHKLYGKQAPPLEVKKWLNSRPLTLAQLRGTVVLLLVAIHIDHYDMHADMMRTMLQKYKDRGLAIVAVHRSEDTWRGKVTEKKISAYLKEHGHTFPVGIDRPGDATYSTYNVKATPAMYLIDKKGILRCSPTRANLDQWIARLVAE